MWFGCKIKANDNYLDKNVGGYFTKVDSWAEQIENNFREYVISDEVISAASIMNNNFPLLENANVFISHSHKDECKAKILAEKLYEDFKLTSFIDSTVWNYSDDILKQIDDQYCYQEHNNTYDYKTRNQSTASIHMMLSVSLMKMMNQCDVFIFIESDNSVKVSEMMKYKTFSPWLFYEIGLFNMIQKVPRLLRLSKKAYNFSANESIIVKFPLDLTKLYELDNVSIVEWNKKRGDDAIISLHKLLNKSHII